MYNTLGVIVVYITSGIWNFDKGCRILLTHCKIRETYCAQTFCKWYLWCVYCLYNITEWLTGVSLAKTYFVSCDIVLLIVAAKIYS